MGSSSREKGVLKLVHPGRHVEYHKEPLTAAEVMKRNPRHCVTRPDVFKYPWIVVRPESLLMPGKVFYIVPNLTIHQLLKARGQFEQTTQNQSPNAHEYHSCIPRRNSPSKNYHDHISCIPKRSSHSKSCAGRTPKHQYGNISQVGVSLEEEESAGSFVTTPHLKSSAYSNSISKWPVDSLDNIRPRHTTECGRTTQTSASTLLGSKNEDQEIIQCKNVAKLKSCVRKEDSTRKKLKLKVTFNLSTTMTRVMELPSLQMQE